MNMEPIIFHIDVNSAYLSWSALDALRAGDAVDLRTIPAVIGGDMQKRHGVVLAKSLPAKKFNIRTGEPLVSAMRKCPNLTVAPPDHASYQRHSEEFVDFLSSVCPEIEQLSIDECFMDYTQIQKQFPSAEAGASYIKDEILRRFGFTVNVGVSDCKVLAKMASDFKKPNLVHTLYRREIPEKLWPLPVSSLYMCGKSSADTLQKLEITTIGALAAADPQILVSHLKSHGKLLWEYANGIDDSVVLSQPTQVKGIGNSITLKTDALTREEAFLALRSLAESVSYRLRKSGQNAGLVSTEIKYADFQSASHQTILAEPSCTNEVIYRTACHLFDELWNGSPVRLLGIRTSKLCGQGRPVQMNLFDYMSESPVSDRQQRLDRALDEIRLKFGENSVVRGSLLQQGDDYKKH